MPVTESEDSCLPFYWAGAWHWRERSVTLSFLTWWWRGSGALQMALCKEPNVRQSSQNLTEIAGGCSCCWSQSAELLRCRRSQWHSPPPQTQPFVSSPRWTHPCTRRAMGTSLFMVFQNHTPLNLNYFPSADKNKGGWIQLNRSC